ncbi:MAG: HAD-IIIC family phosphatase [Caldilinea sp.]|jgi:FkbH-like protein|nr:HAD-IIIC family phosphatase [Caldilinea sp.]
MNAVATPDQTTPDQTTPEPVKEKKIKCVVWDLDQTIWEGVLLEDRHVTLRPGIVEVIQTLDARGILQSIASKNEHTAAMQTLARFGLAEYFLYPQINWNSKATAIEKIAKALNIGLETIAFVDDQPFERDEVHFSWPMVRSFEGTDLDQLLTLPAMQPKFITRDAQRRRQMYLSNIARDTAEKSFEGPQTAFLASLSMRLRIFPAQEEDLQRAEELTVRTNQLNATGYTYSYAELNHFRQSPHHQLLIANLEDTYGPYGHIGLALLECTPACWTIKLLLMSCRVLSRGVGGVLITHLLQRAKAQGVRLQAEFVPTDRNRMMNLTYRFAGFEEVAQQGAVQIFEHRLDNIQPFPDYMQVAYTREVQV